MEIIKGAVAIFVRNSFPKETVTSAKMAILQLFTRINGNIGIERSTDITKGL